MRGIVLAGGTATRLYPATLGISKQLLPIYNKPMVYYPISLLMLAGIRDILIISTPHDLPGFRRLLGDGSAMGVRFQYAEQPRPGGLAEAFIVGRDFIGDAPVCLVLGDNILHGAGLAELLQQAAAEPSGCTLFGYRVTTPERYGVAELDAHNKVLSIEEKPAHPKSNIAVTGLYFYDNRVVEMARTLAPSPRGELEITDINNLYVKDGSARLAVLGRGYAWLDTGTHDSFLDAANFVQVLERRQGVYLAALEEIAFRMGFINAAQLAMLGDAMKQTDYGRYLLAVARGEA
ncbi:MAG: glucose-1-phosphate thymidylyltransferase RfbA [Deltaproteobacteria bacterium]|nr:glucose-1-phosphate thymidylyltransferase RfbA [Deltaproteobacteria bacterium]